MSRGQKDPAKVSCPEMRAMLLHAVDAGASLKSTKAGFLITGPLGLTSVHTSRASDRRSIRNVAASLRRIGIDIPKGK